MVAELTSRQICGEIEAAVIKRIVAVLETTPAVAVFLMPRGVAGRKLRETNTPAVTFRIIIVAVVVWVAGPAVAVEIKSTSFNNRRRIFRRSSNSRRRIFNTKDRRVQLRTTILVMVLKVFSTADCLYQKFSRVKNVKINFLDWERRPQRRDGGGGGGGGSGYVNRQYAQHGGEGGGPNTSRRTFKQSKLRFFLIDTASWRLKMDNFVRTCRSSER